MKTLVCCLTVVATVVSFALLWAAGIGVPLSSTLITVHDAVRADPNGDDVVRLQDTLELAQRDAVSTSDALGAVIDDSTGLGVEGCRFDLVLPARTVSVVAGIGGVWAWPPELAGAICQVRIARPHELVGGSSIDLVLHQECVLRVRSGERALSLTVVDDQLKPVGGASFTWDGFGRPATTNDGGEAVLWVPFAAGPGKIRLASRVMDERYTLESPERIYDPASRAVHLKIRRRVSNSIVFRVVCDTDLRGFIDWRIRALVSDQGVDGRPVPRRQSQISTGRLVEVDVSGLRKGYVRLWHHEGWHSPWTRFDADRHVPGTPIRMERSPRLRVQVSDSRGQPIVGSTVRCLTNPRIDAIPDWEGLPVPYDNVPSEATSRHAVFVVTSAVTGKDGLVVLDVEDARSGMLRADAMGYATAIRPWRSGDHEIAIQMSSGGSLSVMIGASDFEALLRAYGVADGTWLVVRSLEGQSRRANYSKVLGGFAVCDLKAGDWVATLWGYRRVGGGILVERRIVELGTAAVRETTNCSIILNVNSLLPGIVEAFWPGIHLLEPSERAEVAGVRVVDGHQKEYVREGLDMSGCATFRQLNGGWWEWRIVITSDSCESGVICAATEVASGRTASLVLSPDIARRPPPNVGDRGDGWWRTTDGKAWLRVKDASKLEGGCLMGSSEYVPVSSSAKNGVHVETGVGK